MGPIKYEAGVLPRLKWVEKSFEDSVMKKFACGLVALVLAVGCAPEAKKDDKKATPAPAKTETKKEEGKKEEAKPAEGEKKEEAKPAEGEKKEEAKPAEGEKKEEAKPAEGEKKE